MALRALTTFDTVDFVSAYDPDAEIIKIPVDPADPSKGTRDEGRPAPGASVFKLRPLDVFLMGHIYDNASTLIGKQGDDNIQIDTHINKTNIDAVKYGLCQIPDNFMDSKGQPVKWETTKSRVNGRSYEVVTDKILMSFGLQVIQEMAEKIKQISEVTSLDEKKSNGALLPSE